MTNRSGDDALHRPSGRAGSRRVESVDVVIVGAGPAGLSAATHLVRAGRRVVVVERASYVGGLAASFSVADVRVDYGSHRLHRACDPEILVWLSDMLEGDLQRRPRNGRIRLAERWVAFPPRTADAARNLPLSFALRLARDTALAPLRHRRETDFDAVVRTTLGPTMADEFYGPYVRKIWGVDPTDLSAELAHRRVSARSGLDLSRRLRRPDPDAGTFWYPKRGFGELVEHVADAAVDAGADIQLGVTVRAIGADATVKTSGATYRARQVFSTLPVTTLVALAEPPAPPAVRAAAAALRFRALVLLYVVLDRPRYTEFDAHYLAGPEVDASRVTEPKNYRDGRGTDPPDRTVLCIELPCTVGDATWTADPSALSDRLLEQLARVGLPPARATHAEVRRVPHAYPHYDIGFEARFAMVDDWATGLPHVLSFGRQGLFAHDNTHHALVMGRAAAESLAADGTVDPIRWRAARRSFADHVVED